MTEFEMIYIATLGVELEEFSKEDCIKFARRFTSYLTEEEILKIGRLVHSRSGRGGNDFDWLLCLYVQASDFCDGITWD